MGGKRPGRLFRAGSAGVLGLVSMAGPVSAQPAYRVKDINTTVSHLGSNPFPLVKSGGFLYFTGTDDANGTELWKTDGTAAGTGIVRDVLPGPQGSVPRHLTDVGGTLFFVALDGEHGFGLWKTDGTAQGTVLVRGAGDDAYFVPRRLTDVNGTLFFMMVRVGNLQLWKSDGTEAGTVMIQELCPPGCGYDLQVSPPDPPLTVMGSSAFFLVTNLRSEEGYLWKSDGTAAGTVEVKDVGGRVRLPTLAEASGRLFFFSHSGTLWTSDGTTAGTAPLKAFDPYWPSGPYPSLLDPADPRPQLANVAGRLFFPARDPATSRFGLWTTDGTSGGTVVVKEFPSSATAPTHLTDVNATLFFAVSSNELWTSDGTAAGTSLLRSMETPIVEVTAASGVAFLWIADRSQYSGGALWKTDGTVAGTVALRWFAPEGCQSSVAPPYFAPYCRAFLAELDGAILFRAEAQYSATGRELWRSDGTSAGTVLVEDTRTAASSRPGELTDASGTLYFVADDGASGRQVWKSDGSAGGTAKVSNIVHPPYCLPQRVCDVDSLTASNGSVFFTTYDLLWKTDGTPAGTQPVWSGAFYNLGPAPLFDFRGTLIFAHGTSIWKSDGTTAGTAMLRDVCPPCYFAGYDLLDPLFTEVDGTLFFVSPGGRLWKTDGTAAGTVKVIDIGAADLVALNGSVYFVSPYPYSLWPPQSLWKSDGTRSGTVLVKSLDTPRQLTVVAGTLYLEANDIHGRELWKSDGTAAGTMMVKDIRSGAPGSDISDLTDVNGTLFFSADDGQNGRELWKSDGTPAGTVLVADIAPGPASSRLFGDPPFTATGGRVFFTVNGADGQELWTSDGTAAGTERVQDIAPGASSSSPGPLTASGARVYFSADDGVTGSELWALPAVAPWVFIGDASLAEGNTGASEAEFTISVSPTTKQTVTLHYATRDGTATAGSDYGAVSGTLTIAPGTATTTLRVPVFGDRAFEGDETFYVDLSDSTNALIRDDEGAGTITNDDQPGFSIEDVTVAEGRTGPTTAVFTVTLAPPVGSTATVDYATADDITSGSPATAGVDYLPTSGTLTFTSGTPTQTIGVVVNPDSLAEGRETFLVNLTGASGAAIGWGQGRGSILDPQGGGDFDGDGKADILWRHGLSGKNVVWLMDGITRTAGVYTNPSALPDTHWRIAGTNGFDGDGKTDILWRHGLSGKNAVWLMDGVTRTAGVFTDPAALPDTQWRAAATGDVNADGKADILWQHAASGRLVAWFMDGVTRTAGVFAVPDSAGDTSWVVSGAADFSGDGRADILWRHAESGTLMAWFMEGVARIQGVFLSPPALADTRWQIAGVGDYDADDKADLLWRNGASGKIVVWYMDGITRTAGVYTNPDSLSDTNWAIVGPR